MDFVDGELPRIGGEPATVHENQSGQCHRAPPSAPQDRIVKGVTRMRTYPASAALMHTVT
jgi:hypothetical protein